MMKFMIVALIAATFAANAFAEKSSGTCPSGRSNGEKFNEGRYWYECNNGQIVPKGCLDDDDNRIDIDGTFDTKQYRMQCLQDNDGFLTMIFKACMLNGAEHDVGSQWDDGTAFFTCVKEGNNVRVITLGCVDQGKPMKLDDRVAKGDFIYQCKKATDGTPRLNKVGCVSQGKKYNIGELFEGSDYWYTCTDSGSKIVGCMYNGHRLQNGDHFTKDDMMFACYVTGEGTNIQAFACLAREDDGAAIERKVGCFWVEGSGSTAFEYTCQEAGSKVAKVKTQCVYRTSLGMLKVRPGCIKMAGTVAVGCKDAGNGQLSLETYSADQIGSSGLSKC
jgi:hypothetical protein